MVGQVVKVVVVLEDQVQVLVVMMLVIVQDQVIKVVLVLLKEIMVGLMGVQQEALVAVVE